MVCLIFITLVLYTRHYDCTHLTSASCSLVFIYLPTCSPLPQLGTHENFSTRTADSRNEDATVDARSSRRRDRSMSLGSSISSDGEDDQGGPALNMSSPSHSSYYVSTNSYLDTSIYTKMGIPITLSESLPLLSPTISDDDDDGDNNNECTNPTSFLCLSLFISSPHTPSPLLSLLICIFVY